MIKKLESLGHKLEDAGWIEHLKGGPASENIRLNIYKCTKCNHYFRENFFKAVVIMEGNTKEQMIYGSRYIRGISDFTCDETIIKDIIE